MLLKKIIITAVMLSAVSAFASNEGAKLFKKCAICHGINAHKKSLGVSEIIAGWPAEKIIKNLKGYKSGELNKYKQGKMMMGQATKLSETQMKLVANYIESLKPETVNHMKEKRLSAEELRYNAFLKDYFKKNRNSTTKEAKMAWKKHLLEGAK